MNKRRGQSGGLGATPANTNTGPEAHARKIPAKNLSAESRFIGFLVLGFGALAVMAVLLIAFQSGFFGKKEEPQVPKAAVVLPPQLQTVPEQPKKVHSGVVQDLMKQFVPDSAQKAAAPQPEKPKMFFERQPGVDPKKFIGAWQAAIGKFTAVLKMDGKVYQVVLADPYDYGRRQYSSGTYTVMEDIIQFQPRYDWPKPAPPEGEQVEYIALTAASFPAVAAMKGEKMLWQNPPQSETRIYVPYSLAILVGQDQDYIAWQPIK